MDRTGIAHRGKLLLQFLGQCISFTASIRALLVAKSRCALGELFLPK